MAIEVIRGAYPKIRAPRVEADGYPTIYDCLAKRKLRAAKRESTPLSKIHPRGLPVCGNCEATDVSLLDACWGAGALEFSGVVCILAGGGGVTACESSISSPDGL